MLERTDRIAQNRGGKLYLHLDDIDGTATDAAGAVTVTVTGSDGSTLVAPTTAAKEPDSTGLYSLALTPAQTATLDQLTATWTATVDGETQTIITAAEIAGGFLFPLAALKSDLDDASRYTPLQLTDARVLAEDALEDACGVAFVPRYRRHTLSGTGSTRLLLDRAQARTARSVTIGGSPLSAEDLATITFPAGAAAYLPAGWTQGQANVAIGYEHGYDQPPARVGRAARLLAKNWLISGPISDRAIAQTNEFGNLSLLTPGVSGSVFGIPEVDVVVERYGMHALA